MFKYAKANLRFRMHLSFDANYLMILTNIYIYVYTDMYVIFNSISLIHRVI